ncbi:hypothetical protein BDW71DRAFT_177141 [Aspergillus fruticulosus]
MKDNFPTMVFTELPILESFLSFYAVVVRHSRQSKNFEDLLVAHIDEWVRARKGGDQVGNEKLVHRGKLRPLKSFIRILNLKMLITAGHEMRTLHYYLRYGSSARTPLFRAISVKR